MEFLWFLDRHKTVVALFVNTFLDVCRRDWQCAACFYSFHNTWILSISPGFEPQNCLKSLYLLNIGKNLWDKQDPKLSQKFERNFPFFLTILFKRQKRFFFQILWHSHNVLTLGEKLPFRNLTFFVKRSIHTINSSKKFLSRDKNVTIHTRHLNFLTKTERAICISINDKLSCQVPIGISVTQTQNLEAGFTYCFLQAPCGKQATLSPLHLYDPSFSFP